MSDTIVINANTSVVISTAATSPVIVTGGGASAYQIWLDEGNVGTEQDFLDSLVGPPGASDSLGTGFVAGGGSGTIPTGTVAGISGDGVQFLGQAPFFIFTDNGGGSGANVEIIQEGTINMSVYDDKGSSIGMVLGSSDGTFTTLGANLEFKAGDNESLITFNMNNQAALFLDAAANTVSFTDNRATPIGIEYEADYSATIVTNPRSIPDVGTVENMMAANWPLLAPDGTLSAPSYSFENSEGSGIFYDGILNISAGESTPIFITAGSGSGGNGGDLSIGAGSSTGRSGGAVSITAGSTSSSGRDAGGFLMTAGNSITSTGGGFEMSGGSSVDGAGGGFQLYAGSSTNSTGGDVVLGGGSGATAADAGRVLLYGNGVVLPNLTTAQRDLLTVLSTGQTIYNTDATADDSSTGVMQVYNGSVWKNAW